MAVSPNVVPVKVLDPLGMVGGLPQEIATELCTYTLAHAYNYKSIKIINVHNLVILVHLRILREQLGLAVQLPLA